MSDIQESMIEEAVSMYGVIKPCSGKTIEQSFTRVKNKLLFWFNDFHNSTRIIQRVIS
ncbi:MAG: hypothetical protein JNL74_13860 [Fibrobacteres bacterium]|nr:hypothetical protein [Fibrobacterota bacterium]